MEILTPNIEQPNEPGVEVNLEPSEETNLDTKSIEFLAVLGMKDEMFDKSVMEKIGYLAKNMSFDEFSELAIKSGNDNRTSKLDRIFTYAKLSKLEADHQHKVDLIRNAKESWHKQIQ